jgi:electron transfer flavoprotein beta subunit
MLPCGRSLSGARAADPVALVETVETIARRYGHVVIDTPAGLRSDAGLPVFAADGCILVTRPTRPAIADAIRQAGGGEVGFDLLLFGNESADMGNYQVPIRVARTLDLPCVTGIKDLSVEDGRAIAKREISGGEEVYEVDLPAVVSVKEGLNEPRYASMRAKMQAQQKEVSRQEPVRETGPGMLRMLRLESPPDEGGEAEILGEGPDAATAVVEVLRDEVEVL